MKKFIIPVLAVLVAFAACNKSKDNTAAPVCTLTAKFVYTVDTVNNLVIFTDSSKGEINKYSWSFGDDSTSHIKSPTHAYSSLGTKNVCLTVSNADGSCTDQTCISIDIPFTIVPVPSTFTKKALLEEFTGAWCGYCPRGVTEINTISAAKGEKFIPVGIHITDVMTDAGGTAIDAQFNDYGYPGGMVDRVTMGTSPTLATNYWSSKVTTELAIVTHGGLAIDASKINGDTATIVVHAGFNSTLTGNYTLNVYVIEGSVKKTISSYDQHNYMGLGCSSPDASSPWYNFPCVINNFDHKHVLRKILTNTPVWGETIPASSIAAGKEYVKTYKLVGLNSMDKGDLFVVAFIDKNTLSSTGHQVINVQEVKIGSVKSWD